MELRASRCLSHPSLASSTLRQPCMRISRALPKQWVVNLLFVRSPGYVIIICEGNCATHAPIVCRAYIGRVCVCKVMVVTSEV